MSWLKAEDRHFSTTNLFIMHAAINSTEQLGTHSVMRYGFFTKLRITMEKNQVILSQ